MRNLALFFITVSCIACSDNKSNESFKSTNLAALTPPILTPMPPPDCDQSSTLTSIQYRPIGSGIRLRSEADEKSSLLINKKATEIFHETHYLEIDDTVKVIEECTKGGWSWVRLIDPDYLVDTHKGWIESKYLPKNVTKNGDKYSGKISSSALTPYKKNDGYGLFESRFSEIENLRKKAAEIAIDSGDCGFVVSSDLSVTKSTIKDLKFWVECENGNRKNFFEFELR